MGIMNSLLHYLEEKISRGMFITKLATEISPLVQ